MLETINLKVYQRGVVLLKTKHINQHTNCDYCGDKLSPFSNIALNNFDGSYEVRGKYCPSCDLVYIPYGIPKKLTDEIKSTFGKLVDIVDNQYDTSDRKDDTYGCEPVQKYVAGNSKTMGKTSRIKSRTHAM